jgi:hypothetical protein
LTLFFFLNPELCGTPNSEQKLFHQRGLPDPWLTGDEHDLALAASRFVEAALQLCELGTTPNDFLGYCLGERRFGFAVRASRLRSLDGERNGRQRRDKFVPPARHGLNKPGLVGIITKNIPEVSNITLEVISKLAELVVFAVK